MRFVDFKKPGSPDVLFVNERPIPEPGSKEILVQVKAAGVNRPDLSQRAGHYPLPPRASPFFGLEIAGIVSKIGVCAQTHGIEPALRENRTDYTQNDSKVGFWQGSGANFCVWSERPLLNSKARVKTENLLPS